MRDLREVFPGLDSGPNGSEGHYSMPWKNVPQVPHYILLGGSFSFSNLMCFVVIRAALASVSHLPNRSARPPARVDSSWLMM